MRFLEEQEVECPYCGEAIVTLIDPENSGQQYVEDCQVCCRPITFIPTIGGEGEVRVSVHDENEAL